MAASLHRIEAAVFILTTIFLNCEAQFPTKSSVETWKQNLEQSLGNYVSAVLGEDMLLQNYNNYDSSKVQWTAVDGAKMAAETAKTLGEEVLGKKIGALKESVKAAEDIASNYDADETLTIDNYHFNNAKKLNKNTLSYSPKFGKLVNDSLSSVHVPVEIYYGDKDILNGLRWTEALDGVWKQNAEKDPNLLWQYFGGQKGFLRSYPANAWTETKPDLYDVRRRPWYTQGSSSPKNMMILVDTSGSTTGEALQLMKETVKQLLETLGENDFVAVANYSKTDEKKQNVRYVSECFQGFVQATHRNKQVLKEAIMDLQASGMAIWEDALKFAFKSFKEFEADERNSSMNNVGANCNRIIMVLTDGATAKDEADEIIKQENPDGRIRIFTYAIGKTAAAIEAVRWLACKNRGYFSKIPAMGAIRTTVQEFFTVLNRPLALAYKQVSGWTSVYEDALGLGMMITLTLPVYNRSTDSNNQTILGVMGVDVTTAEMEKRTPWQQLGPNGYAFAMNLNGYTVFHPNLKAQLGYLKDPPNVDFLEVEHENPDKVELRKKMINNLTGSTNIETFVTSKDLRYTSKKARSYFYTGIPSSSFSLGLVVPEYTRIFPEISGYQAKQLLEPILADADQSQKGIHVALWICDSKNIAVHYYNNTNDTEIFPPNPVRDMVNDSSTCDSELVQHFLWDYVMTENMTSHWDALSQEYKSATEVAFVSTNSGLTRLYPHNMTGELGNMADPREHQEFKRAMDETHVLFSAPYKAEKENNPNTTGPAVTVVKAVTMTEQGGNTYKPAVVGAKIYQTYLTDLLLSASQDQCSDLSDTLFCYLIDDGAFIVSTNQEKDEIGRFFGDSEPALMMELYNGSNPIYDREQNYDWQGVCKQLDLKTSAGPRSFFIPSIPVIEMLTVKWWTSSVMWAYANFNLYNWVFESAKSFVYAQEDSAEESDSRNESCVTEQVQYYFTDVTTLYSELVCENCTRQYSVEKITGTNLLLVVAEPPCGTECDPLAPEPKRGPYDTRTDPDVPAGGPGVCEASRSPRYRLRPEGCFDFDEREEYNKCRGCGLVAPSLLFILSVQLIVSLLNGLLR